MYNSYLIITVTVIYFCGWLIELDEERIDNNMIEKLSST